MIVPFPPGGLADVIARVVAEGMRARLGQTIIIENVGGATGSIGSGRVARAAGDGYTVLLGIWNTHVANGATYALPYDIVKDFEPVVLLADAPLLIVAKKTSRQTTSRSSSPGSPPIPTRRRRPRSAPAAPAHLLGLLLQKQTGTRFGAGRLSRRGPGDAGRDGRADRRDVQQYRDRAAAGGGREHQGLCGHGEHRLAAAPDIPPVDEAGMPGFFLALARDCLLRKAPRGTRRQAQCRGREHAR